MQLTIRPLAASDVDHVVEFALRAWEPNFVSMERELGSAIFLRLHPDWRSEQAQVVAACCRDQTMSVWVADVAGRPVGYVAVKYDDGPRPCGEIDMLAVDPDSQGQGVGGELTTFALDRIREAGYTLAFVGTGGDRGHAAARRTYERAGFTPIPIVRYVLVLE
jgi:GNAT superfamily N-acetyltransferase